MAPSLPLHQFDYIFAVAMIFAFLDAFMIGMSQRTTILASMAAY